MSTPFHDIMSRHQVLLERLKTATANDYAQLIPELESVIELTLTKGLKGDLVSAMGKKKLKFTLEQLRVAQQQILDKHNEKLKSNLKDISDSEVNFEKTAFDFIGAQAPKPPKVKLPPKGVAWQKALEHPMSSTGQLMDPFIKNYSEKQIQGIENAVQRAWAEGKPLGKLMQEIRGTKANNFQDGILSTSRHQAEAVARTSVQHVSQQARMSLWEANNDLIKEYEWLSTLDGRTSQQCKSLDGQKFLLGKGPQPPIHINCRSTTLAVLGKEFDFLDEGATRSSKDGYVAANQTYYEWLKKQPAEFQDEALGPTRAKLFREGGLNAEQFAALNLNKNFQPMNLAEMQRKNPVVFEKAGVNVKLTPAQKEKFAQQEAEAKAKRAQAEAEAAAALAKKQAEAAEAAAKKAEADAAKAKQAAAKAEAARMKAEMEAAAAKAKAAADAEAKKKADEELATLKAKEAAEAALVKLKANPAGAGKAWLDAQTPTNIHGFPSEKGTFVKTPFKVVGLTQEESDRVAQAVGTQKPFAAAGKVNIEKVETLQDVLLKSKVADMVDNLKPTDKTWEMPIFVDIDGKKLLWDGNHRAAAALLRGEKEITAITIKVPAKFIPVPAKAAPLANDAMGKLKAKIAAANAKKGFQAPTPAGTLPKGDEKFKPVITSNGDGSMHPMFKDQTEIDTGDVYNSVYTYASSGYKRINGFLRGKAGFAEQETVNQIDRVMKKSIIPEDIHLYRGFKPAPGTKMDDMVGFTINDKAYTSTSLTVSTARAFAGSPDSVIFRINVAKGQQGLVVNRRLGIASPHYSEQEVILPRDTTFRVLRRIQNEYGVKVYEVEIVPKD